MSTFEIQVYKGGIWNVDSYFDDREIAMSEAERLNLSGRHAGVRVLQEDYDETTNEAKCRIVFSKTLNQHNDQEWRVQAKRNAMAQTVVPKQGGPSAARATRRRSPAKKSNAGFYVGLVIAFMVLIAGIAAMIGLQEIAKYL